jgi:ferredoxin-NADP reductase
VLGLPVGGHLNVHLDIDGDIVTRKYTPISLVNEKGVVKFVIKIYNKTDEFPKGGKASLGLESIKVGEKVKFEGPKGFLAYHGHGKFQIKKN